MCVCVPMLTMGYVVATNLGVSSLQHRACVLNFPVQAAQVDRHFIHFHRCVGLLHPLHDRQKIPLSVDLFLLSGATAARSPALASATPNLCLSKNLKGITSQASEIKLQTCARRLSIRSTTNQQTIYHHGCCRGLARSSRGKTATWIASHRHHATIFASSGQGRSGRAAGGCLGGGHHSLASKIFGTSSLLPPPQRGA
jgi:hypothetical protein